MLRSVTRKYSRKRINRFLLVPAVILIISLYSSCTDNGRTSVANNDGSRAKAEIQKQEFSLPPVPEMIVEPAARVQYLVSHYWDRFDFADTTFISLQDDAEQVFADYIYLLLRTTPETAAASIGETLRKSRSTQTVYDWFREMYEKYLYDVNSPFREEEYYAMVPEHMLESDTDSSNRIRPALQLAEINKNRKGTIATDFSYVLTDGKKGTLHGIQSEYTLLFFYDPGCGDCKRTEDILKNTKKIAGLVEAGTLKIVALYPDNDLIEWVKHHPAIPQKWINARDASNDRTIKEKLYAIRAIPSLYLLDKDKRVILKDATAEQVLNHMFGPGL